MKISAVYKITNTVTGDFYIGSSKNVKKRLADHKCKSVWKKHPNSIMYKDMKKYGTDKFIFQILAEAEPDSLKEAEQWFIEMLKPNYNSNRANGWDVERYKEAQRKASRKYQKTDKYKKYKKEYQNQLCFYNGQTLTLNALRMRFVKSGISNPTEEAKKYLIGGNDD